MSNKGIAGIVIIFVIIFMSVTAIMGISGHIPFLRGPLTLISAIILLAVVLIFFVVIVRIKR